MPLSSLTVDRWGLFGQMITDVSFHSGHVSMLKLFRVSRLNHEFEIQHTAHRMDCDDPDLEALNQIFVE